MRLGGFEPPTNGLEGRRSSTELQAPEDRLASFVLRSGAACGAEGLAPDAEVGGDDRDSVPPVDARGRIVMHGGEPDLLPVPREEVRAVAGAVHPGLHRPAWRDGR